MALRDPGLDGWAEATVRLCVAKPRQELHLPDLVAVMFVSSPRAHEAMGSD